MAERVRTNNVTGFNEATLEDFLQDVNFIVPGGGTLTDFVARVFNDLQPEQSADQSERSGVTSAGEQFDSADSLQPDQLPGRGIEALDPSFWAEYFAFNTSGRPDGNPPVTDYSRQLNIAYPKKNLKDLESASDVGVPDWGRSIQGFPKHYRAQPSMVAPQLVEPTLVLEQPTLIEGIEFPAGTRVYEQTRRPK